MSDCERSAICMVDAVVNFSDGWVGGANISLNHVQVKFYAALLMTTEWA